jgi:cytochrome P450
VFTDPDLVPFEPPTKPLRLRWLPTLWRNYIETIPRAAYAGGVVRIRRRNSDVLLVCDPGLIGEVLVEKADAFGRDAATRRAFSPMIGDNSLFLAEGAEWRWQRRAVAAMFRHDALLSFVPIFAAAAARQVERWRTAGKAPIDAAAAMTRTTFDIIVEAMLGGTASLDANAYSRALAISFATIPWHLVYTIFALPAWMPYPGRRRAIKARIFLQDDIRRLVEARRGGKSAQPDLLDLLLAARDPESGRMMTDDEVMKNLITFITAGHETTSVALTWTLWLLAKDQATQQRVLDEVTAIAGAGAIGATQIEGLSFTRQVIQEAMRLFPPAAAISRLAKMPMTLGDIQIGAGARVHIPIYTLHRNEKLWANPNAFDPDRFAPERAKTYSRYAYLPFGGGPRICIGASFAMLEAAVILASLVRAFRFAAVPGHRPKPVARVTLRPHGGMPLMVTPR